MKVPPRLPPPDGFGNYWFGARTVDAGDAAVLRSSLRGDYLAFAGPRRGFLRGADGLLRRFATAEEARRALALMVA